MNIALPGVDEWPLKVPPLRKAIVRRESKDVLLVHIRHRIGRVPQPRREAAIPHLAIGVWSKG